MNGRHNFKPITSFDTSALKVKCAAQIDEWDPVAMGLNKKEARRMDRFTVCNGHGQAGDGRRGRPGGNLTRFARA